VDESSLHLRPSILTRLIDFEPEISGESAQHRLPDFEQMKRAVVKDLERLLNTKSGILPVPPSCKETGKSLFVYGLKDFTSQNPKSPSMRHQLSRDMERAITRFEPRLRNVTVRIDTPALGERDIQLRITGLLVLDPVTEPVMFDTIFDVSRYEYRIRR
jgi:type VI secretion system protein ImpF